METEQTRTIIREEIRRYVGGLLARYVPILAAVLAFVLLVVLVPDGNSHNGVQSVSSASGLPDGSGGSTGTTTQPGGSGSSGGGSPSSGSAGTGAAGATQGTEPGGSATTAAHGGSNSPGHTQKTSSNEGVAVNGTKCKAGVRQVSFTHYAPYCVTAWHGNNGGATSHGVTSTAITMIVRNLSSSATLDKIEGAGSNAQQLADMETLVNYFNKQFELYGRHVVIKIFNGKGNGGEEASGQDQQGASTDATTAYNDGAFMDPTVDVGTYNDALTAKHIINFSIAGGLAALRAAAPYRYQTQYATEDEIGAGMGALVCQRMKNLPAIFAGSAAMRKSKRKFAIIEPSQPQESGGARVFLSTTKACGVSATRLSYPISSSSYSSAASQMATQLKAGGYTTVISEADPLFMEFLTESTSADLYDPEWVITNGPPEPYVLPRIWSAQQVKDMLFASVWAPTTTPFAQTECYRIFKRADPSGTPQSGTVSLPTMCAALLAIYGALQNAGPDLTPETFERGWFSQPSSTGIGEFGPWSFGTGAFSPDHEYNLEYFNTAATSRFDGKRGAFEACKEPWFAYTDAKLGSGQPNCYLPSHPAP